MTIHEIPFATDLLGAMAETLWSVADDRILPECLVLLPSSRACRTLEKELWERRPAPDTGGLLLPRARTLTQWIDDAMVLCGLSREGWPDDRVRALALAPLLADLPWLRENPENAPGLADEFLSLFDEARLEERAGRLWGLGDGGDAWLPQGPEGDAVSRDVDRIGEVWRLYRKAVPRDRVDSVCELTRLLVADDGPTLPTAPLVLAGGFGKLTRTDARLLTAALRAGREGHLFLARGDGKLDRVFAATWPDRADPEGVDPFSPDARLRERLREAGLADEMAASGTRHAGGQPLRERLAAARDGLDDAGPADWITLRACADPESEAREVTARVVDALAQAGDTPPRIGVATPDLRLAARILAQLEEAGVPADNSLGRPLASLPAGLLVRFMLRAALTDLRFEPLLEVLTHPFVSLPVRTQSHPLWTLRLERMCRRMDGPQTGLAGLAARAGERDAVVRELFGSDDPGMAAFIDLIAQAFAPLLEIRGRKQAPWPEHVRACRDCLRALMAGGPGERRGDREDEARLEQLWDVLAVDGSLLEPVSLAEFGAAVNRLLAGEMVAAHRPLHLPVMVTGLVEARLERWDHLILAGMQGDVFPSPASRDAVLTGPLRRKLGLPGWREHVGLEAELMLRLLHNGGRVTVTWPCEVDQEPVLVSPLVERLALALYPDSDRLAAAMSPQDRPPRVRARAEDATALAAAQARFEAEPRPAPAMAPTRPRILLSWSALKLLLDCPYRFLLERGFALRREEDLRREFGRMDYGSLVHEALCDFLAPDGAGQGALLAGDADAALKALDTAAVARFSPGSDALPVRRLWLDTFRRAMPGIVQAEIRRRVTWRPLLLERKFRLPLAQLVEWTRGLCGDLGLDLAPRPGWEGATDAAGDIALRGTLDRVDAWCEDESRLAVLDYKTGSAPTVRKVQNLEDLQVLLYAAAVEMGVVDADLAGARVVEGAYYAVSEKKQGPPGKPHLDGSDDGGRELLAAGMVRLIDLALEAAATDVPFPLLSPQGRQASVANLPCARCDMRGVCRIEEERGRPEYPASLWPVLDRVVHKQEGSW